MKKKQYVTKSNWNFLEFDEWVRCDVSFTKKNPGQSEKLPGCVQLLKALYHFSGKNQCLRLNAIAQSAKLRIDGKACAHTDVQAEFSTPDLRAQQF